MTSIGSNYGLARRATIRKYNNDGTVQIRLDERTAQQPLQEYRVPMPLAWAGQEGEFMGGYPPVGSTVIVKQSQGGQWLIDNYIPSLNTFNNSSNMSSLKPGRILLQTKNNNKLFIDPGSGIHVGSAQSFLQADPNRSILSHNFAMAMEFTQASRFVNGIVLRDIVENSSRNIIGSTLNSHVYNDSLTPISMDPSAASSIGSDVSGIRNPPLVESREVVYEFADNFGWKTDSDEAARASGTLESTFPIGRKGSRADVLSLSLNHPNHLMEVIKGTVVDIHGNILDLNRNILPIGRVDELSLRKNPDKADALTRIRALERKSLAYHWEINTRKAGVMDDGKETIPSPPDVNDFNNYARNRSRFFLDIDKEGQFKLNVPASSETGNIAFLTRYENYPSLLAKDDETINPNEFLKNAERRDIYLDSFSGKPAIKISTSDSVLDGYEAPVDRKTNAPMLFGTAFHDITKVCFGSLPDAVKINLYEPAPIQDIEPYEKFVEENLIVSGKDANIGGRSGTINFDGHISLNVGANTSDRQSLWTDFAGGIVSQVGRDKRGVSWAAQLDGDLVLQIGGVGIGNTFDSRFAEENDGARIGALDIKIMANDRPMTIFRLDGAGIQVATEGKIQFDANQGIHFTTHGNLTFNGERVAFFTNTQIPRLVQRGVRVAI